MQRFRSTTSLRGPPPEGHGRPQVHYNLADPASAGKSDSTTVHLQFANSVNRQLAFLLPDGLLESLSNPAPDTLPPGQADVPYTSDSRCSSDRRAPSPAPRTSRAGTSTGSNTSPSDGPVAAARQSMRIGPAGTLSPGRAVSSR
jgi:hypothetical protein